MARPKKIKALPFTTVAEADARAAALEKEIEELTASLKSRKSELKELSKARAEIEAAEVKAKAEAAGFALLQALEESGKTLEEAINLIKN